MPTCSHCGSFVTADYARVTGIEGDVLACPQCPDRIPSAAHESGFMEVRHTRESGDSRIASNGGEGV